MRKRQVLWLLIFFLTAGFCFGQARTGLTDQLALFWDVTIGSASENSRYAEIIARSTLVGLERRGFKPVPGGTLASVVPSLDRSRPVEEAALPRLIELAKEHGSSFVVLVSYYREEPFFTLEIRAWDLAGRRFYNFKENARTALEVYNRLEVGTSDLVRRAGRVEQTPDRGETENGAERTPRGYVQEVVLLSGDEGCEIYINGVIRAGVITDGRLSLHMPLSVGSKLSIEKRLEDHFTDVEEFTLTDEWLEIPLRPMERIVVHEGLLIYTMGQFVGFGIGYRYYIVPGSIYVGGENYFFLQTSDVVGNNTVFHDDLRALAGLYLVNVPGVPLKVEIATGLGCIFTYLQVPPNPLFTDFYFNMLNITVEFKFWQITFFIREEIKLGLGIGNNLLGGDFFFIRGNLPIMSLGAKIPL
ncbi:MAG TPA: hypothetical protein ENN69_06410 [Spirochaetia bacterium]|nr:hypothetical protein [Spirochaetia bacterium]